MNDDREVTCYALLTRHLNGVDVREAARAAWFAQRDLDDGCNLLAARCTAPASSPTTTPGKRRDWPIEANRFSAARAAASLVSPDAAVALAAMLESPERYLSRKGAWQRWPRRAAAPGAGHAGVDAHGRHGPRRRGTACCSGGWQGAACRSSCPRWHGPRRRQGAAQKLQREAAGRTTRALQALRQQAAAGQARPGTPMVATTCWLAGARGAALRGRRRRTLGAGHRARSA